MSNFAEKASKKVQKLSDEQLSRIIGNQQTDIAQRNLVLDNTDDGYLLIDSTCKVLYANNAVHELLRTEAGPSHARVRTLESVVRNEEAQNFIRECVGGTTREFQFDFKFTVDNDERLYEMKMMRHTKEGFVFKLRDITFFKDFIEQFRKNESLAQMTTVAAQVAHEIKNPLGSMSIYMQLLSKELEKKGSITKEKADKYLAVVNEEIERLNKIAVDFLYAVRPMNVSLFPIELNDVAAKTVELCSSEMEGRKIALVFNPANSLPKVMADSGLVEQSLLNLVKNAQQAISGRNGKITVSTYVEGNYACLSVQDNGCGMTEEQMTRIFEPYYTTKSSGSGLGLTVIYKVMKAHGGDVTVSSVNGEGSVFVLQFPVRPEDRYRIQTGGEA